MRYIAADNSIELERRWKLGFTTPALWQLLPQAQLTEDRRTVQRHEIALKIERAIGQLAVEDFVTPPPAAFAKGRGKLTFAAYTPWRSRKKGTPKAAIIHTRTKSSDGCRIEVCLFASIENCAGYLSGSNASAPYWSSSSTPFIEDFIANRGRKKAQLYDDDESIAVEILRTVNNQGMLDQNVFKRFTSAEWFMEVYHDIELDKDRWSLRPGEDLPEPVDRIVIGAPLWVRSTST